MQLSIAITAVDRVVIRFAGDSGDCLQSGEVIEQYDVVVVPEWNVGIDVGSSGKLAEASE